MNEVLIIISICSPLPGLILGLKSFKNFSRPIQLIAILLMVAFISDITATILALNGVKNLWLINLYGLISGIIILLFYYFTDQRFFKSLQYLLILFVAGYLYNMIFLEGVLQFNALGMSLMALLIIVVTLIFFYKVYRDEEILFLEKSPIFLISTGILFYYSGALFSFLLSTDILKDLPNKFYNSWILHNFSNVIKNIFFCVALWKAQPTSTMKSSSS